MEMAQPSTPCPNLPQCFYLSFLYLQWFLLTMFMWQPPYPLWPKQVSPPLKSLPFLRVQEIYHECQIYPDVSHPFRYILSMPVLCYNSKTEAFQRGLFGPRSHIYYLALCETALLIPALEPHSTQEAVTLYLCLPYSLVLQL